MNANEPPKTALIAITKGMAAAGVKTLDVLTAEDAEDITDVALVTSIFIRMWQVYMAECEAIKRGKQPKIIKPNALLMPSRPRPN